MHVKRVTLGLCLALLLTADDQRPSAAGQVDARAALQARADALMKDVLRSAIGPGAIREVRGELQQLVESTQFRVRADMQTLGVTLSPAALPEIPGFTFGLMTLADANAEARRSKARVWFVQADIEQLDEAHARVRIGPDYALPPDSTEIKTCCCVQQVAYRLDGGRWVFDGRLSGSCG